MIKTISSIKAWLKEEEERLQRRILDRITTEEFMSLCGSLVTIRKIRKYLEQ